MSIENLRALIQRGIARCQVINLTYIQCRATSLGWEERKALKIDVEGIVWELERALSETAFLGALPMHKYLVHRRGYVEGKPLDLASEYDHSNMEQIPFHFVREYDSPTVLSVGESVEVFPGLVVRVDCIWHGADGKTHAGLYGPKLTAEMVASYRANGWTDAEKGGGN